MNDVDIIIALDVLLNSLDTVEKNNIITDISKLLYCIFGSDFILNGLSVNVKKNNRIVIELSMENCECKIVYQDNKRTENLITFNDKIMTISHHNNTELCEFSLDGQTFYHVFFNVLNNEQLDMLHIRCNNIDNTDLNSTYIISLSQFEENNELETLSKLIKNPELIVNKVNELSNKIINDESNSLKRVK